MNSSPEILKELQDISPILAGIEKRNVFSVPEGYFDTLTVDLLKVADTRGKAGFTVPLGYFENLTSNILNKIKAVDDPAQELRELSPMLYSVQNENVFTVPPGYFNQLENAVLENILPKQAKVVSIKKNFVWKYAVAAVMTGVIGLSSLMIFTKSENISRTENITSYTELAAQFKNESQINDGIAKLSDDEIIGFLETTTNVADNETLTQGIEDKELPAENEYLINEQTLQTYLNGMNVSDLKN